MQITLHLFDKTLLSFKAFLLMLVVMSASSVSAQVDGGYPLVDWNAKFGNVSISSIAPVIVTQWSLESDPTANGNTTLQWCDVNSNAAARTFLIYLQNKGIGLLGFPAICQTLQFSPGTAALRSTRKLRRVRC